MPTPRARPTDLPVSSEEALFDGPIPEMAVDDPPSLRLAVPALSGTVRDRLGLRPVADLRGLLARLVARGLDVELEVQLVREHTSALDLVDELLELCRLSLNLPGHLSVAPGSFVPTAASDPWVAALPADLLDDTRHHAATLERLREAFEARLEAAGDEAREREWLARRLDDAPRRLTFEMLRRAWLRITEGWPGHMLDKAAAMETAEGVLGHHERWIKAFRLYTYESIRRLVLIPTWQCELRCAYCFIPKQDGREMPVPTMERAIDMLMATDQTEVVLQFFGGEALLEYERVQHAIVYAEERAAALGKQVSMVVSSNGWSLTEDRIQWLAQHPVRLELSIDGDAWTQNRFRASRWKDRPSYDHSIATHAEHILASGIEQYVIMVVHPVNVENLAANFFHIADLGYRHIQINNMLGREWNPDQKKVWAEQLFEIGRELTRRWDAGEQLEFINMRHRPMAMRLNGEVTVDHDGTVYGGNGFLHETEHKATFAMAHLDDHTNIDRYWMQITNNDFLLEWSYKAQITANNLEVGKVMASFCRWLKSKGYDATGRSPTPATAPAEAPQ